MSNISKSEFLNGIKKSRVIDSDRLKTWLETIDSDNPVELAARLVKDNLLTKWQAKYLMTGRTRLDIGSYRLLERVCRDELGDRFVAIHIQLGRKVDIQVLPSDLTDDKQRCDAFIQKASKTAQLDHPNLIHVFDIDQESGRYFLVTEHVGGAPLNELEADQLTNFRIGRYLDEAIRGILHAHENGITHSDLTVSDLILTDEDALKIRNLSVSPIRKLRTNREQTDFEAIAEIGTDLLNSIENDSDDQQQLRSILQSISAGTAESVARIHHQLDAWVAEHAPVDTNSADQSRPLFDFDSESGASGDFDQPVESGLASRPRRKSSTEDDDESETEQAIEPEDGFLVRLAKENPVALIASSLVIALMLIGGTVWGAYSLATRNREQAITQQPDDGSRTDQQPTVTATNTSKNQPSNTASANRKQTPASTSQPPPVQPDDDGPLSQPTDIPQPDFDDPEAIAKMIDAAVPSKKKPRKQASQPKNKTGPNTNQQSGNQKSIPVSTTDASQTQPPKNVAKTDDSPAGVTKSDNGNSAATEPAKSSDSKTATSDSAAPAANKKTANTTTPTNVAEPFKNFPRVTDLPPVDVLEERKIADLVVGNNVLMGAEIYADPAVSRTKLFFEVERTSEDKQKWIVGVKRREKDQADPIATFRKTDSAFFFQWLPEAADNKYSEFLRNCLINLKLPDQAHWLALRGPILMDPLQISAENPFAVLEQEIPGLPELDSIQVQVLPMRIPQVESSLSPAMIDMAKGIPGRIILKKSDKNAFVWIQVGANFSRSKLTVRSDLVLLVNGQIQPIKDLGMLQELINGLKQLEIVAAQKSAAAKKAKAPSGQGERYDQIRSELEKAANLSKKQTAKAIEYSELVPKFLDQRIEIRVNAKLGQHTIELAKTRPASKK